MAAFVAVAPVPPVRSAARCGLKPRRGAADRARDFLTQRSVQQVMFCARVLRDETTTRWLEAFLGHEGLDDLHHCDALRVPSDEYITQLLNEPPVTLNIKKPIPGRTTNSNPYLKRRYFSYDVDIVPRTIGLRVLEARKQIANELSEDLPIIAAENKRILGLHRKIISGTHTPSDLITDMLNFPSMEKRGSPYRHSNFDLVKNYTLYLAMLSTQSSSTWLANLVETRGPLLIAPHGGEHGEAADVLVDMLAQAPAVGADSLFDPAAVTEKVLAARAECAEVWRGVMLGAAQEQLDIERGMLEGGLS